MAVSEHVDFAAAAKLLRLQRCVEHLHSLGPWALAHFLADLTEATGCGQIIAAQLGTWQTGLTREEITAAGADHFPPYLAEALN